MKDTDARVCKRCGTLIEQETDRELKKEYPYYCPVCDENMYSYETIVVKDEDGRTRE